MSTGIISLPPLGILAVLRDARRMQGEEWKTNCPASINDIALSSRNAALRLAERWRRAPEATAFSSSSAIDGAESRCGRSNSKCLLLRWRARHVFLPVLKWGRSGDSGGLGRRERKNTMPYANILCKHIHERKHITRPRDAHRTRTDTHPSLWSTSQSHPRPQTQTLKSGKTLQI